MLLKLSPNVDVVNFSESILIRKVFLTFGLNHLWDGHISMYISNNRTDILHAVIDI